MPSDAYASRGGIKLAAALDAFAIDVAGLVCCDLGSHAGGFVDCLLRRGAARVYAVDTGFGVLDHRLRRDPRVVVHERTNALAFACPEPCALVTIDVGWTTQRIILPVARRLLAPRGRAVTLVKPQYEAAPEWVRGGVVRPERLEEVFTLCRADARDLGWRVLAETPSPIAGRGGNVERLWLLSPEGAGRRDSKPVRRIERRR